jgi:hypothetical protein
MIINSAAEFVVWTAIFFKVKIYDFFVESVENDIFQIAKNPMWDGKLILPDLKNEFC